MKWRIVTLAIIVVVCVANHAEHHFRAQRIARQAQEQDIPVVQLDSSAAGHSSLRIEESGRQKAGELQFSTLEAWAFSKDAPPPWLPPAAVAAADGQAVRITGFMYPLRQAATMNVFCLLRSTQTCCYGPKPQYNQYLLVETREPVKFERLAPVVVNGVFHVDARPDEGYIYRMDSASVRSATGNDQPPSPQEVARQANLPLFDFAPLEQVKATTQREDAVERLLAPLDGKEVVLHGFLVGKTKDNPTKLMVGNYAWDGKGVGMPPGIYNTVLVSLQHEKDTPPAWWREAVFKGTLRLTRDPAERTKKGVLRLENATLAVSSSSELAGVAVDAGLILPMLYELLLIAAGFGVLIPALLHTRRAARPSAGGTP